MRVGGQSDGNVLMLLHPASRLPGAGGALLYGSCWSSLTRDFPISPSVLAGVDPFKKKLPMPRAPLLARNGQCNIGMPRDTYQRFLWVIKHFAKAGFKVGYVPQSDHGQPPGGAVVVCPPKKRWAQVSAASAAVARTCTRDRTCTPPPPPPPPPRPRVQVVIDNHVFLEDPTAYENPAEWARMWAKLAADVARDPLSKEATMFDLVSALD